MTYDNGYETGYNTYADMLASGKSIGQVTQEIASLPHTQAFRDGVQQAIVDLINSELQSEADEASALAEQTHWDNIEAWLDLAGYTTTHPSGDTSMRFVTSALSDMLLDQHWNGVRPPRDITVTIITSYDEWEEALTTEVISLPVRSLA